MYFIQTILILPITIAISLPSTWSLPSPNSHLARRNYDYEIIHVDNTASTPRPTLHLSQQDDLGHCLKKPLTPKLWNEMKMDDYLRSYPGGNNLTLPSYADQVGVTNFQCGIGTQCSPSQICAGSDGRDWYALAAAHRWNTFNNQIYEATAYAIGIVSDVTPTMIDDLIPDPSNFWTCAAVYSGVLAAAITGTPAAVFGVGAGKILWMILIGGMYVGPAVTWIMANLEVPDPQKFTRWSESIFKLQDFQSHLQAALTNYTQAVIDSPISSDKGLYGISKNGTMFEEIATQTENEIQSRLETTLKLKALKHILRIQNAFITRGSEPCDGDGPGGSRAGNDQLSYCDSSGIMMNIVIADKDQEKPLYHASLIFEKYGISTELLTTTAWKCQEKYGEYEHKTVVDTTHPYDTDSACLFNLPVCDLTKYRADEHGMNTVEVCRKVAKLPI